MIKELVVCGLVAVGVLVFILVVLWLVNEGYLKSGEPSITITPPDNHPDNETLIISALNRGPDVHIEDLMAKANNPPSVLKTMFWDW